MARKQASPAANAGIKTMPTTWKCVVCATENVVSDEISKRGLTIFHGYSGQLPLECHSCGEMYLVPATIP